VGVGLVKMDLIGRGKMKQLTPVTSNLAECHSKMLTGHIFGVLIYLYYNLNKFMEIKLFLDSVVSVIDFIGGWLWPIGIFIFIKKNIILPGKIIIDGGKAKLIAIFLILPIVISLFFQLLLNSGFVSVAFIGILDYVNAAVIIYAVIMFVIFVMTEKKKPNKVSEIQTNQWIKDFGRQISFSIWIFVILWILLILSAFIFLINFS